MLDENNVLRGPDPPELPNVSFGSFSFDKLKHHPENHALLTEAETGRVCTSEEFLQLSVNAAEGYKQLGIVSGDVVSLIATNTININVAAVGAIFIGAVMSPLDPTMKSYEYQHMFGITEPKLVICDEDILIVVKEALDAIEMDVPILSVQENSGGFKTFVEILIESSVEDFVPYNTEDIDELSVIVGSSGTTGLPKGVGLTHRNYVYEAEVGKGVLGKVIEKLFLHTSHFFWVSGIFAFALSLSSALRRVIVRDVSPESVLKAIQEYKPWITMPSPSLVNSLLHHPDVDNYDLSSLHMILTAGSPLQKATVDLVKEKWGNIMISQAYGLSELSGAYLRCRFDKDPLSVGTINIGTALKIVDLETGENLPLEQEGELYCWSVGLMKGYIKNDEATAEAIVDGWLRTGDTGYITSEGLIYITGRLKELMKLDNHQIAPAEIEQVIHAVPGVADVGVVGIQVTPENHHPMALVVKEENSDVSEEEIIKSVNENLSEFKQLQAGICFVDRIPRTTTGKIKRKDLQVIADDLYMAGF